jgi:hypothetical protein
MGNRSAHSVPTYGGANAPKRSNRKHDAGSGFLGGRWSVWFDGLRGGGDADSGTTTIAGPVTDQAALHGVVVKIRDLGLPIVALRRI